MKTIIMLGIVWVMLMTAATAQSRGIAGLSPRDARALLAMASAAPIQFPDWNDEQKALIVDPIKGGAPVDHLVFNSLPKNVNQMDSMHFRQLKTFVERNRYGGWLWQKWVKWALDYNDKIEQAKQMVVAVDKADERDLQRRSVEAQEAIARALRDQMVLGR